MMLIRSLASLDDFPPARKAWSPRAVTAPPLHPFDQPRHALERLDVRRLRLVEPREDLGLGPLKRVRHQCCERTCRDWQVDPRPVQPLLRDARQERPPPVDGVPPRSGERLVREPHPPPPP